MRMMKIRISNLCVLCGSPLLIPRAQAAEEIYPKHCNAKSQAAVKKGLDYLAKSQTQDGNWAGTPDTNAYPVTMTSLAGMAFLANGNTPTRGPYADNVRKIERYLIGCATPLSACGSRSGLRARHVRSR